MNEEAIVITHEEQGLALEQWLDQPKRRFGPVGCLRLSIAVARLRGN